MSADYLMSSLPAVPFDGPAPLPLAEFLARCRAELGYEPLADGDSRAEARRWRDLDAQMRNTAAEMRAKALGADASRYRRATPGCSLYWRNRISAAFAETDPMKRQTAVDRAFWDAAGELTPPAAPLSAAAAYTYRVRLEIALRRAAVSREEGNRVFDAVASAPEKD